MNKIFTAFFIQAITSAPVNTKIQTIALYSTVKDKNKSSYKLNMKKRNLIFFFFFFFFTFNFAATRHNAFKFSLYSLRKTNCECEHNYAIEKVYNTVRKCHQNCKNFCRSFIRKSFVHWIPANSCSGSGTLTSGFKYLKLLVTDFKRLFSYWKGIFHPSAVTWLFLLF